MIEMMAATTKTTKLMMTWDLRMEKTRTTRSSRGMENFDSFVFMQRLSSSHDWCNTHVRPARPYQIAIRLSTSVQVSTMLVYNDKTRASLVFHCKSTAMSYLTIHVLVLLMLRKAISILLHAKLPIALLHKVTKLWSDRLYEQSSQNIGWRSAGIVDIICSKGVFGYRSFLYLHEEQHSAHKSKPSSYCLVQIHSIPYHTLTDNAFLRYPRRCCCFDSTNICQ
ncbi:uncharacterized protein EDB91DRAFT_1116885 [Suillus paluster]|uniref:uncharacterized protein n=1 Tax=Suillus paluster TaxID=48578 RepID=UPI001B875228|nr:uncharacterized protein EDB91DRAFT_1116885 [Suillus paluster]KAG1747193.1 hypothetical protein EDB91DRAFT_1116885 [Suillus paluster]